MRSLGLAVAATAAAFAGCVPSAAAPAPDGSRPAARTPEGPRPAARASGAPDGRLVLAVLTPERVMVADPRTGATREREVPGGTLCHGPVLALGDRVVHAGVLGGRAVALSLPLSLRGPARSLGRAQTFVAAPGRVWLGHWRRTHTALTLREIDARGRPGRRVTARLARWAWVAGIVDGAPLIRDDTTLRLAREAPNPPKGVRHLLEGSSASPPKGVRHLLEGLGAVRVPGGWPLAVGAGRFAWCRGQDTCRAAGVWSAAGSVGLDPPAGVAVRLGGSGAFSPDGRRLALPVQVRGADRVAVVDLGTGRWELGGRLAGYRAVAWSPSGRWVYATAGRRVTAWAPGGAPPRTLPVQTGGTVMSIATTR